MRDYKKGRCPNCLPEGGAILGREITLDANSEWVDVWECRNCGWTCPRITRARITHTTPNATQLKSVERFKEAVHNFHSSDRFPTYTANEAWYLIGGNLYLTFDVAHENDEGTMLGCLRPHYHARIGRKGGWAAYGKKSNKLVTGWHAPYAYC